MYIIELAYPKKYSKPIMEHIKSLDGVPNNPALEEMNKQLAVRTSRDDNVELLAKLSTMSSVAFLSLPLLKKLIYSILETSVNIKSVGDDFLVKTMNSIFNPDDSSLAKLYKSIHTLIVNPTTTFNKDVLGVMFTFRSQTREVQEGIYGYFQTFLADNMPKLFEVVPQQYHFGIVSSLMKVFILLKKVEINMYTIIPVGVVLGATVMYKAIRRGSLSKNGVVQLDINTKDFNTLIARIGKTFGFKDMSKSETGTEGIVKLAIKEDSTQSITHIETSMKRLFKNLPDNVYVQNFSHVDEKDGKNGREELLFSTKKEIEKADTQEHGKLLKYMTIMNNKYKISQGIMKPMKRTRSLMGVFRKKDDDKNDFSATELPKQQK